MFSFGSKSRSALTTVNPPIPESNTPIGRSSLMQRGNSSLSGPFANRLCLSMIQTAMAELSKIYDPKTVEPKWYQRWIDNHDFEADADSKKKPFSIVMPPPNITGVLTLGHVLNNTIQDILARRARMHDFEVLWLPGMDHAGIGTQTAVERWLKKNEGVTRHDLGRETFLQRVLEWQDKHGGIIIKQLKRLGCSADWSRQRYTMDEAYARAVAKVFVDLYKKGLIYRGCR